MGREEREKKVSAARQRAEQHTSGHQPTLLNLPQGMSIFEFKKGVYRLAILPYKVKRGQEVPGGNPFAKTGILFFERTFFVWRKIGPDQKDYCAPGLTFGKRDPIMDDKVEMLKKASPEETKALRKFKPQEQQIFLVLDLDHLDKGIQLLKQSNYCFGELLDSRVKNSTEEEGWDLFYFPDEDGMNLRVTVEDEAGEGFTFPMATAIDFLPRKGPLPDKYVNHGYDLDDMLVDTPSDKLAAIYFGAVSSQKEDTKGKESEDTSFADDVPSKGSGKTEPDPEPKKEEKKAECEFKKGDKVIFEGKPHRVHKVNLETGFATLLDVDDEPVKAELTELKAAPEEKKEEPKKKALTAEEARISKESNVKYEGKVCSVFRISADGLTLMLMDSDDEVLKDISVGDVELIQVKKEEPKEEKKTETKKETATSKASVDDDDWDKDWDK